LRLGEVGVAFVITRPDSGITGNEVTSFAREHLANFNVPRRAEIVDETPLNASGKGLKGNCGLLLRRGLNRPSLEAVYRPAP
jgi:acyl-CoA synthetase (AMP-forming)/AMP-acid ligase II